MGPNVLQNTIWNLKINMRKMITGRHHQSISCVPENTKGAGDKVAKYCIGCWSFMSSLPKSRKAMDLGFLTTQKIDPTKDQIFQAVQSLHRYFPSYWDPVICAQDNQLVPIPVEGQQCIAMSLETCFQNKPPSDFYNKRSMKWVQIDHFTGQSTGSNTCGTTTSLEMNKKSSPFYLWRCNCYFF